MVFVVLCRLLHGLAPGGKVGAVTGSTMGSACCVVVTSLLATALPPETRSVHVQHR